MLVSVVFHVQLGGQITAMLVQNMERLDETVKEESDGVHNTLGKDSSSAPLPCISLMVLGSCMPASSPVCMSPVKGDKVDVTVLIFTKNSR